MNAYDTVGSLAAALQDATNRLSRIEQDVEHTIGALFAGWRPRFPRRRGWRFTPPDALAVYGIAEDSPAAIGALHRAGFRRVTVHDHVAGQACRCATHVDDD